MTTTFDLLVARFGGAPLVDPGAALALITGRVYTDARQAAANALSRGRFPVPTVMIHGRRLVRLQDLAAAIDDLRLDGTGAPQAATRRGPGRPRRKSTAGGDR